MHAVSAPAPSRRSALVKPFYVMEILEKAQAMQRAGLDVVHLEVGEPDFETPQPIRDAAEKALRDGHTHYTHSLGLPELREAICQWYHDRYKVEVTPDRIAVTNGVSPAMLLAFCAILDSGDKVLLADPHYACYPNFIRLAGGEPVFVPVREEEGYQPTPAGVRAAMQSGGPGVKALLVNSPGNPTGTCLDLPRLQALADAAPCLVSDEIYNGLVYAAPGAALQEVSALQATDQALVLDGFSKRFAMTGMRLGYLIFPPQLARAVSSMTQTLFISPNTVSQWAGVAALRECASHVEAMRTTYDQRRRLMIDRLTGMGFSLLTEPTGAFYVFVNVRRICEALGQDSLALANRILEEAHVGVTPGIDFGPGGEGHLRFSYATSLERIEEGLQRLARWLERTGCHPAGLLG
ncbi:pyridoxal phosphate-dependent aminotransferase [Megalodesulfovibrio gigas]|uniref:Aminotransferase n=1 Tax=Megalodesulfovibrio gigas (strain ATCC 19364 / DSM 1382 / NCIMB 9332 / VKM B-1759) TaxID=1121448 RepID=T2GC58_MEGG1|nr:pyridoxal phosphate-dependent aminotransferase [Megalodesulfovibrio gigas]AGW13759.1 putative Aspartate aminotransferase [Megalodesulfovibrio gigas DSM 1382 = ATCC 19364]